MEPLEPARHAQALHHANREDAEDRIWTYLPYGPFDSLERYVEWMQQTCCGEDPMFHAIVDLASERALGVACYLRITPASGSIDVWASDFNYGSTDNCASLNR